MRVLLADDQADVRSALRFLLEQESGIHVVGEVAEVAALVAQNEPTQPDFVLLDWELPGAQSIDLLLALRAPYRSTIVIAISSRPEARQQALAAGADAFVSKGEPPDRLLATLSAFT